MLIRSQNRECGVLPSFPSWDSTTVHLEFCVVCLNPDQKEVEIQCLSSTESVISSSASSVQIQYRIQWENSVWGVLVQYTLLYFCRHIGI